MQFNEKSKGTKHESNGGILLHCEMPWCFYMTTEFGSRLRFDTCPTSVTNIGNNLKD